LWPTPFPHSAPMTPKPVTGELIDPRLADVEAIARWMDSAFVLPGGFRFGLAGFIGIIPGIGDVRGCAYLAVHREPGASTWDSAGRRRTHGAQFGIEGLPGAAPFVGDLFDVVFKANRRDYFLLNRYLAQPRRQHGMDWLFNGHPACRNCCGSAADLALELAHSSFGVRPSETAPSTVARICR
jgi:Domain of unknown function (DUF4112)